MSDPTRTEEDAWMRAAQDGDTDAFGHLFRRYHARTVRSLIAMMGGEEAAQPVAQEAWVKAWNKRANFNFQSSFYTWMHRIATNTALDALRARKRQSLRETPMEHLAERPAKEPNPAERALQKERWQQFQLALNQQPHDQRTTHVLREMNGYSYQEIADLLECKIGTVMSRLHAARQKLAQIWNAKS
ncbi:MAG: sigma-70 family RNA polymerase sigma factor [Puniceicoccales bacterium]